jgi:hypothetical protein
VSVRVESDELDVVSASRHQLCPELILRVTEVVETGYDNSRGEPRADLLGGVDEPGSLASIPVRGSVLPDHARKRPSALVAGSLDGRCLTLELGWVLRACVPDRALRALVAVCLWRRGRRLAVACPGM